VYFCKNFHKKLSKKAFKRTNISNNTLKKGILKIDLRNYIVPSIPFALLLMAFIVALWFTDIFTPITFAYDFADKQPVNNLNNYFASHKLMSNILSLLLTGFNAYLIGLLNNRFTIIRARSFLPVLFFIFLLSCWHDTHSLVFSHASLTLFILAIFVFFSAYHNNLATEQAFLSSLLIATASLIFEPLIFLIPILWIGFILFRSLSFRMLLATLIGVLTPWLIYITARTYLQFDFLISNQIQSSFQIGLPVLNRPINEIIYLSGLFIIFIISIIGIYTEINNDSLKTRAYIHFIIILALAAFILSMLFMRFFYVFLPFVAMPFAILVSYPITLKKNNFYRILFIIFVLINLTYVASNIYQNN